MSPALNEALADPELRRKADDAALVAQIRKATIAECSRWLCQAAAVTARTAFLFEPKHRQAFFDRAEGYRSAANLLEVLRT